MSELHGGQLVASSEAPSAAAREVEARLQEIVDRLRGAESTQRELEEARMRLAVLESTEAAEPQIAPADVVDAAVRKAASPNDTWLHQPQARPDGETIPRLGEMLLDRGLVTVEQLDEALVTQRKTGQRIGRTLVEMGAIASIDLISALADRLGVPFVDLVEHPPNVMVGNLISAEVANRYRAIPVDRLDEFLVIAMAEPGDVFALDDLRVITGERVICALAEPEQITAAIERMYQKSALESTLDDAASDDADAADLYELLGDGEDGPIVRLVNALLEQALDEHASDLHIEPTSHNVTIRMRIDGILHDKSDAPLTVLRPLVSRLKVLGALDIAQSRVPQDGRFSLSSGGRHVDVRIMSIPTAVGESIVLRLLDPVLAVSELSNLGLDADEEKQFASAFRVPQGAVIITGPTGSGKSSTLYAALSEVNNREKSVVSVEDPVEYRVDGIKQVQINTRAGMTFPSALRSLLRADPDVMLIGEIRDAETARIAADASITGHLVLSTLHANSAAAAPMRLIDMGVEPYLVASALTCVAAQRLHRQLCPSCVQDFVHPDRQVLVDLGASEEMLEGATLRTSAGCRACFGTGYRGRTAVFEIMQVTEQISRMIVERAPSAVIERAAVEEGMQTLRTAALKRVAAGELSIDEFLRVMTT